MANLPFFVWPIGFLALAVADDLIYRKFHNGLFLALSAVGFLLAFFNPDLGIVQGSFGFFVGGLLMLPLVLVGALGAGDMKFMMCFGCIMGMNAIFQIFVYSILWGGLIGLLSSIFSRQGRQLFSNLKLFFLRLKPAETHKIPYTVAILFGWLSFYFTGGLL